MWDLIVSVPDHCLSFYSELWAKLWDMIFNNNKCHHMHVGEHSEVSKYEMGSGESRTEIQVILNFENCLLQAKPFTTLNNLHNSIG